MSLPMDKRSIREALLRRRVALDAGQRERFSQVAQTRVLELSDFHNADTVALYSPIRNEVDTALLATAALEAGKTLCFPCVDGQDLHFVPVAALGELVEGRFGICEPRRSTTCFDVRRIDLLLVPGVAFDLHGHRLGYGGGFFDRFLAGSGFRGRRLALAYDFQIVDVLPAERHDQVVDLLVTDQRVINPAGKLAGSP